MNVSSVIARIAGTESTANRMSTIAMPASAAQRGENGSRAATFSTSAFSPSWSWRWRNSFQPVQIRKAANTKLSQPNARQRRGADDDEEAAQDEREHDAVGQHPMPLGVRQREGREHEQEHEDVVERERLLDQVAGQERLRVARPPPRAAARRRTRAPRRPTPRWRSPAVRRLIARAAHDDEVDDEQDGERADQEQGRGQRGTSAVQGSAEVSPPAGREHRAAPSGRDRVDDARRRDTSRRRPSR